MQFLQSHRGEEETKEKGFASRSQAAPVTPIVLYPLHSLLKGPSSTLDLFTTYSQASIKQGTSLLPGT